MANEDSRAGVASEFYLKIYERLMLSFASHQIMLSSSSAGWKEFEFGRCLVVEGGRCVI